MAINEDGTLNGADHPAPIGSVVFLFLTGAGPTDPSSSQLALPVTVQVGGAPAEVINAGPVTGWPGVAQVSVRIPPVAASDAVPVHVTIGGISQNQLVTIALSAP